MNNLNRKRNAASPLRAIYQYVVRKWLKSISICVICGKSFTPRSVNNCMNLGRMKVTRPRTMARATKITMHG